MGLLCVLTIFLSRPPADPPSDPGALMTLEPPPASPRFQTGVRRVALREALAADQTRVGVEFDNEEAWLAVIEQMVQDRRTWLDTGHLGSF